MARVPLLLLLSLLAVPLHAARLTSISVLDRDYVVVQISDGDVVHNESPVSETVTRYTPALDTGAAMSTGSWTITSSQDASYGGAGRQPTVVYRKTKLSGHGQMEWTGSDFRYEYTYQHWIFLRLPTPLQQGMSYTVTAAPATNASPASGSVTFDVFSSRSEAVHVNLVGYITASDHKAADLYAWLGNGGARDYTSFEGNTVYLYNVATAQATPVGMVTFWKPSGSDVFWYNLTRSPVWNADFTSFTTPGTYRLAIEGVDSAPWLAGGDGEFARFLVVVGFESLQDHISAVDDVARNSREPGDVDAVAAVGGAGGDFVEELHAALPFHHLHGVGLQLGQARGQ